MSSAEQKADLDPNVGAFLQRMADLKLQACASRTAGGAVPWLRPDTEDWSGGLQTAKELVAIHQPFNTDAAEEQLKSAADVQSPGNVGDGVVLPLQIDYMAQAERAYRARVTQTFPRSVAHTIGRDKGHGQPNGVFLWQVKEYFLYLLRQAQGTTEVGP